MEKPAASSTTPPEKKSLDHEEPKTLTAKQFQEAREAAMEVLKKHDKDEATKIFTEGLETEKHLEPQEGSVESEFEDDYDISGDSNLYSSDVDDEILLNNYLAGVRDVVSAPF